MICQTYLQNVNERSKALLYKPTCVNTSDSSYLLITGAKLGTCFTIGTRRQLNYVQHQVGRSASIIYESLKWKRSNTPFTATFDNEQ